MCRQHMPAEHTTSVSEQTVPGSIRLKRTCFKTRSTRNKSANFTNCRTLQGKMPLHLLNDKVHLPTSDMTKHRVHSSYLFSDRNVALFCEPSAACLVTKRRVVSSRSHHASRRRSRKVRNAQHLMRSIGVTWMSTGNSEVLRASVAVACRLSWQAKGSGEPAGATDGLKWGFLQCQQISTLLVILAHVVLSYMCIEVLVSARTNSGVPPVRLIFSMFR